jgi:hypothetical protein
MKKVRFGFWDLLAVAVLAEREHAAKLATGAHSKKHDQSKSEFEVTYYGKMGEWACRKAYGAELNTKVFRGGDNGIDAVINGQDCHVKTNTRNDLADPHFFVNSMEDFTAPFGIGTLVMSPTEVRIAGCISKEKFAEICTDENFNHGPRLAVLHSQLDPVEEVILNKDQPGEPG